LALARQRNARNTDTVTSNIYMRAVRAQDRGLLPRKTFSSRANLYMPGD
jgi:hypothetical protein